MIRTSSLALLVALVVTPASAQGSPGELAELLASLRVAKVECRVRPDRARLDQLVRSQGYNIRDFTPGGRYFGLVTAALERRAARGGQDRAARCARLAEEIRTNPLNRPPAGGRESAAREPAQARRNGRIDLNRASLEELNTLPGVGLIGRAIMRGRPYRSPEDLADRRILNARDFARVRNSVTVR